jgi:hypothetical protein
MREIGYGAARAFLPIAASDRPGPDRVTHLFARGRRVPPRARAASRMGVAATSRPSLDVSADLRRLSPARTESAGEQTVQRHRFRGRAHPVTHADQVRRVLPVAEAYGPAARRGRGDRDRRADIRPARRHGRHRPTAGRHQPARQRRPARPLARILTTQGRGLSKIRAGIGMRSKSTPFVPRRVTGRWGSVRADARVRSARFVPKRAPFLAEIRSVSTGRTIVRAPDPGFHRCGFSARSALSGPGRLARCGGCDTR